MPTIIDERERLRSVPPLRMSDLVSFLAQSGRYPKCPFCSHDGYWEFHLQVTDETLEDEDPLLVVYELAKGHSDESHGAAAITCPKCAHLSLIDLRNVKLFKSDKILKERDNG